MTTTTTKTTKKAETLTTADVIVYLGSPTKILAVDARSTREAGGIVALETGLLGRAVTVQISERMSVGFPRGHDVEVVA